MQSEITLPYNTDKLKMSSVLFESMVNNLGARIRRMNLQLHFKEKTEVSRFRLAVQRAEERDDAEMNISSDDQEEDAKENSEESPSSSLSIPLPLKDEGLDCIVIDENFEKTILLRQHFLDRLRGIEERLKVKIMVVPMKVKISGCSRERVETAQDEYRELQQDICFEVIDRSGKEVFMSKHFKNKLASGGVKIVEILRKYYFWFLKSEAADPFDLIQEVFRSTRHALYPLRRLNFREKDAIAGGKGTVVLGEVTFAKAAARLTEQLFVRVRARIFEDSITKRLQQIEERPDRQVELSEDRESLILHMDAEEQVDIQSSSIEDEYRRFDYLYLIFAKGTDMKLLADTLLALPRSSNISFSKDKSKASSANDDLFIWEIMESFLCIGFTKLNPSLTPQERLVQHPISKMIEIFPKDLLTFRLGIVDEFELPEEDTWAFLTNERDRHEKLTLIGPKSFTKNNFLKLAALFIQGKFSAEFFEKEKERAKIQKMNASIQQDVSVDMSRQINQSTQFLINDLSMDGHKKKQQQNPGGEKDPSQKPILSSEIMKSINYRFEGYSVLLVETPQERERKYASDVAKPEREKLPYSNNDYLKVLSELTTFKFKLHRAKLPSASRVDLEAEAAKILEQHPEMAHLSRWITVFAGGKEGQVEGLCEPGKTVKVMKLEKNYKIREGWLLLTNPLFIYAVDSEELPANHYEPVCFIRKIE